MTEPAPAATPGHALHELLSALALEKSLNMRDAWGKVLQTTFGSADWPRRHAEVVRLFQAVLNQLLSLPESDGTRLRGLRYATAWYDAIVWPKNWDAQAGAAISQTNLDLLASVADVLAARSGHSLRSSAADIETLRDEIAGWLQLVRETTDLPASVREEIAAQLAHVQWLLDNIETFGTGAVVRETEAAIGKVTETLFTRLGVSQFKKRWIRAFGGLVIALGLFSQGLEATNKVLQNAQDTVHVLVEISQEVGSIINDPAEQPALQSGTPSSDKARDSP